MNDWISNSIRGRIFQSTICAVVFVLLVPLVSFAEVRVSVEADSEIVSPGDVITLTISISGDELGEVSTPEFINADEFTITPRGTETQHTIVNGSVSDSMRFTFSVLPNNELKPGKVKLPGGSVRVGGTEYYFRPTEITVSAPGTSTTSSNNNLPKESNASGVDFAHIVDNTAPYIGEQIVYSAKVATRVEFEQPELGEVDLPGFSRESFGDKTETSRVVQGTNTRLYTVREALFPLKSGELVIPQRTFSTNIRVPKRKSPTNSNSLIPGFFPELFGPLMYDLIPKRLVADEIALEVKALPPGPKTSQTYIPVGEVSLSTSISSTKVKQGESFTVTLVVHGDANLRPLEIEKPNNENAADYNFYFDKPEIETTVSDNKIIFTKTFKIAVVAAASGELPAPRFSILTFNPHTGQYVNLVSDAASISVTANDKLKSQQDSSQMSALSAAEKKGADTKKGQDNSAKDKLQPPHVGPQVGRAALVLSVGETLMLALVISVLGSGVLVFFYIRRRAEMRPKSWAALETTLKKLDNLDERSLDIAGTLAQIIRGYVAQRMEIDSSSLTTNEMFRLLCESGAGIEETNRLHQLLQRIDELRYGFGGQLSLREVIDEVRVVITAIDASIPRREEWQSGVGGSVDGAGLFKKGSGGLLLILFGAWLLLVFPGRGVADENLLETALVNYQAGNFELAAQDYERAIRGGAVNGDSLYNLGNSYFLLGQYGRAIYYFRLAKLFSPRDPDIQANLRLARSTVRGKEASEDVGSFLLWGAERFSQTTLRVLFLFGYFCFWLLLLYGYGIRGKISIQLLFPLSLIIVFIGALGLLVSYDGLGNVRFLWMIPSGENGGVVVGNKVSVYAGDSKTSQVIELLSDGEEITTGEVRGPWTQVYLPSRRTGWSPSPSILHPEFSMTSLGGAVISGT